MGIFPFGGIATTYGYLVDKIPCYTLFDTCASKAMLSKKVYDEYPILHQCPKYPINVQPIQVANDQFMTVKEAIKFLISFGHHTFEIIAYLLPFSTSFDFIFGLKTMTEIEGKSKDSKLEFTFKKTSTYITPTKDIHLPVGKTTAFDCEMVKKLSDLSECPVVVKMKSQREDCLPQTLRVAMVNGKICMNVTNAGQRKLHIYRGQNIGVADLRSAGFLLPDIAYKDVCMRDSFSSMKKNLKITSHSYLQLMKRHSKRIQVLT